MRYRLYNHCFIDLRGYEVYCDAIIIFEKREKMRIFAG